MTDDEALHALTQKAPKTAKYNFCLELKSVTHKCDWITAIERSIEKHRKAYNSIKSDFALVDRRREKIKRKESTERIHAGPRGHQGKGV